MPIATIQFDNPLNSSLQLGDIVYYSTPSLAQGSNFNTSVTGDITKLGTVFDILSDPIRIKVFYQDSSSGGVNPPSINDYIMFEKDKQVNSSSLIGYYANIKLMNDSKSKIELFSLGSEVSESSK